MTLIAGGIGLTPLRAMLEELPTAPGRSTFIHRAVDDDDLVLRDEIEELAARAGRRRSTNSSAISATRATPICSSAENLPSAGAGDRRVRRLPLWAAADDARTRLESLKQLGVPQHQIHCGALRVRRELTQGFRHERNNT